MTGEVVGQVASQTLENLTTIAEATTLEVLRPLVGMDKDEITAEAAAPRHAVRSRIIPDQDCCTLFTPQASRHPVHRVRSRSAEQALPIDEMVSAAVAAVVVEDFRFPVLESESSLEPAQRHRLSPDAGRSGG